MSSTNEWLLKKRGLYYRPGDCGYTGIRDHAGRYSMEEARARVGSGVSMVRLDRAPEFTAACFDDLALAHLAKQRDAALAEIARLRAIVRVNGLRWGHTHTEIDQILNGE